MRLPRDRPAKRTITFSQATSRLDLATVGLRLIQRSGPIVLNESEVRQWTPDSAIIWSRTETSQGSVYFLTWVLARRGDHWVIQDIQGLNDIVPDRPGVITGHNRKTKLQASFSC